jgi:hypothetical protein
MQHLVTDREEKNLAEPKVEAYVMIMHWQAAKA